jgi:hypothetical protein
VPHINQSLALAPFSHEPRKLYSFVEFEANESIEPIDPIDPIEAIEAIEAIESREAIEPREPREATVAAAVGDAENIDVVTTDAEVPESEPNVSAFNSDDTCNSSRLHWILWYGQRLFWHLSEDVSSIFLSQKSALHVYILC